MSENIESDALKRQFQSLQEQQQKKLLKRKQKQEELKKQKSAASTKSSSKSSPTKSSVASFGIEDDLDLKVCVLKCIFIIRMSWCFKGFSLDLKSVLFV